MSMHTRAIAVAILLTFLCQTAHAQLAPIVDPDSVDPDIPHPSAVIGHAIGDGAVRYDRMVEYLQMLANMSDRITLTAYGETHEGRILYYATVTSAANHRRLDDIREANAKLADPRGVSQAETDRIARELPGIAWMAYCIHGDELSGTDASLLLAYRLVAGTDDLTRRMREQLIVHIDPLQNPDGRERYLAQIQTLTGVVANPDYAAMHHSGLWAAGRGNHYLFDLNRDWVAQSQPETRGRIREILRWNPHLLVDGHEMSSLDNFLFDPPREPINPQLDPRTMDWRKQFSADQAAAFDQRGWSYYTQEWYEEWGPFYTNSWASLLGTVGLLYEQASLDGDAVKKASGEIETYHDAVAHQYVSSVANLTTLLSNRAAILADYAAQRRVSIGARDDDVTYLIPPSADRSRIAHLAVTLTRAGIEVEVARDGFAARNLTETTGQTVEVEQLPPGTLIVRAAQPQRRLLTAILEFDPRMTDAFLKWERSELEKRRGSLLYDITAWSLPMAHGVRAMTAESIDSIDTDPWTHTPGPTGMIADDAAQGYIIDGFDSDVHRAVVRLMDHGCRLRLAEKPFTLDGRTFPPGSVTLRRNENPDNVGAILHDIASDLNIDITSTNTGLTANGWDLGGLRFHLLHQPRVAIASQWPISTTSFGAIWHDLDNRVGLRCSPVNVQNLGDLRRYNVLVLPSAGGLSRVLTNTNALKEWIEDGGTLITIGSSTSFIANEKRGLSQLRLRRDMLEKLDEYNEAVDREIAAREVEIDHATVWGDEVVTEDDEPAEENEGEESEDESEEPANEPKKLDKDAKKRLDEWQRLFAPRGAFVHARIDDEHWLAYGVGNIPVVVSGSSVYLAKHPVQTPVRITESNGMRMAGLLWPEARERLSNSAFATVERVGNGQIITFANDPVFRSYHDGTARFFRNAVIFGPGMGTNQPVPW